jgi:hypothetical protein
MESGSLGRSDREQLWNNARSKERKERRRTPAAENGSQ